MTSRDVRRQADALFGYAVVAADGRVLTTNDEFLRLAGRDDDDADALTLPQLLPVGDRMYYETHLRPALAMHGQVREIALELVRPDGTKGPVLVNADIVQIGGADVVRLVVFEARDRRRYEPELLRARRAAEEAEERARSLAQVLQQTFIPPSAPQVPGLDVAGAYRPAGDGSEVGGDFYDVFQVGDDEWVVAVGDVCGKGVEAAVMTAFVRHTLRGLAVQHTDPSQMLRELNTAMLAHRSDRFCTLVVMRLLKEDDDWLVAISSAGHPLPVLISADGDVAEIGAAGSLVGVLTHPQLDDQRHVLSQGDTLLLYTDGVTEARGASGSFGVAGILPVIEEGIASASDLTGRLLDEVLRFQDGTARDDIAIISLTVGQAAHDDDAAEPPAPRTDVEEKLRALLEQQDLGDADPAEG
jgi:sigma-B regulation protein RsbU (phosphoserine phosphatase)